MAASTEAAPPPASKRGALIPDIRDQPRNDSVLPDAEIQLPVSADVRLMTGRRLARATPISAYVAAASRSAAITAG